MSCGWQRTVPKVEGSARAAQEIPRLIASMRGAPTLNCALRYCKMLKWPDVLKLARDGNPAPARKVVKTEAEWRQQLTDEQYRVTRQAGTERAFSSEMCSLFEPGLYSCLCCDTLLFDSNENSSPTPGGRHSPSRLKPTLLPTASMARQF